MGQIEENFDKLGSKIKPKIAPKNKQNGSRKRFQIGDKVEVPRLGTKAIITAMHKNEIEVQLGHFRTTLTPQDLLPVSIEEEVPIEQTSSTGGNELPASPGLELDLRGQISEDALANMDTYLDQAYLAHLPFVRIIHGKGSGVLRKVVRDALQRHPLISSYKPGQPNEGGDGVTMAKLAVN